MSDSGGALTPSGIMRPLASATLAVAEEDRARVDDFIGRASADATLRAYRSDWRMFTEWCVKRGYLPMPATPEVTSAYLAELAHIGTIFSAGRPLSRASIERRLAAIVFVHRAAGLEPPTTQTGAATLATMMRGIRNAKRADKPGNKRPADADVLRDIIGGITGDTMLDLRDRALLTMGMMGAFRRSELVGIRVEDIAHIRAG